MLLARIRCHGGARLPAAPPPAAPPPAAATPRVRRVLGLTLAAAARARQRGPILPGRISSAARRGKSSHLDHPGTGRASPTLFPLRGRCAAIRPRRATPGRYTRLASLPAGISVVTARAVAPPCHLARQVSQARPTLQTMPGRRLPRPGGRPAPPDRSPDRQGRGRVRARVGDGTLSRPGGRRQVAPARRGITPRTPGTPLPPLTRARSLVIRC
jgi:hypothetical protein